MSWHESSASARPRCRATRRDLWTTRSTAEANKDGRDSVNTLKQAGALALDQNVQLSWRRCPPLVPLDQYQPRRHFTLRHPDQTPEDLRYLLKGAGWSQTMPPRVYIGYRRGSYTKVVLYLDAPKDWGPRCTRPCQLVYEPSTMTVVLHEPVTGVLSGTRRYLKDIRHSRAGDLIFRTLVEEGHLSPKGVPSIHRFLLFAPQLHQ